MYKFNPTDFKFVDTATVNSKLASYCGGQSYVKVTEVGERTGVFWYTVIKQVAHSEKFTIYNGVYENGYISHSQVYHGCITEPIFAEELLIHLMGTETNKGTKEYGAKRLFQPSKTPI